MLALFFVASVRLPPLPPTAWRQSRHQDPGDWATRPSLNNRNSAAMKMRIVHMILKNHPPRKSLWVSNIPWQTQTAANQNISATDAADAKLANMEQNVLVKVLTSFLVD